MEDYQKLPLSLRPLERLSWNYWWSWADGSEIFRDLDPNLWAQCEQNPRLLLTQISDLRLAQIATDPLFVEHVRASSRFWLRHNSRPNRSPTPASD